MLNFDILNGVRPRFLNFDLENYAGSYRNCTQSAIPSVDETASPCNGLIVTTDCVTSTKAFNFFGTGVGEYLTIILDKIAEKARLTLNLVNINTAAIAAEVARATAAENNIALNLSNEILRATAAENLKANIASPTLTGIPNAPTAAPGTNTFQIATTAFVNFAISAAAYILPTATGSVLGGIKIGSGLSINGSGVVSVVTEELQKTITYPANFIGTNYTLTNADNGYSIIIANNSTAVTITVPTGLSSKFQVGLVQIGTADVTVTPSGTTVLNAISGFKIKGQYDQVYLEQDATTSNYYLFGNTKV